MRTLLHPQIDIRRAGDRFKTEIGWLDSKHSFSFGTMTTTATRTTGCWSTTTTSSGPAWASRRTRTATWRSSPQVAAFNATAAPEAFTRAARALHASAPGDVGQAVFDLATQVGAPTSLADLGLRPDATDAVAAATVVNPRPVTEPDLVHLLRAAFAGTRPVRPGRGRSNPSPDPAAEES
jgi:hypothetical protein